MPATPSPLPIDRRHLKRLKRRVTYLEERIRAAPRGPSSELDGAEVRALRAVLAHADHCPCAVHRPKESQTCAPVGA